jgi:hypothetical protein
MQTETDMTTETSSQDENLTLDINNEKENAHDMGNEIERDASTDGNESAETQTEETRETVQSETKAAESVVEAQEFMQVFRSKAEAMDLSFEEAVERLFSAHEALEKNPEAALKWLQREYSVTLGEEHSMKGQAQYLADLYSLRDARDEKGCLKYPHFKDLQTDVLYFMQSGRAKDATSAYEMAFWSKADMRNKHLSDLKESYKQAAQEMLRAEESEKAVALNVSSEGRELGSEDAHQSMRQTMTHLYDELCQT